MTSRKNGPGLPYNPSTMNGLLPSDAARYPLFRLGGLFLTYLVGVLAFFLSVGLPSDTFDYSVVGVLVGPSIGRVVLLALMAWQVFELVLPPHARPRSMSIYEDLTTTGELATIGFGVFLAFALGYTGFGQSFPFVGWIVGLIPLFTVAWRRRTFIDGERRIIVRVGTVPHLYRFDAVAGLGTLEVRRMRGGAVIGTQYSVALFMKDHDVVPILRVASPTELPQRIAEIAQQTGLPIKPAG